jgi:hypothetical protein
MSYIIQRAGLKSLTIGQIFYRFLLWALLLVAAEINAATNLTPVAVTGFNRDVVIENTASGPSYTNYALEFNSGEGKAYYQNGLSGQSYGLPLSSQFTNATDGTVFQFQPYTASNALVLYSNSAGSLTLTTPTTYSRIAVIANSGTGTATGTGTVILTFNDGSSFVTNYNAPDWFNNTANVALQGIDRILLTTGVADGGSAGNPRFYQTTIPLFTLGTSNKPLSSLTFGMPASTKSTGIYAVSGLKSSDVSPPAVINASATGVFGAGATLNGQVTTVGGETPSVTLFYGTSDGGTTAGNWSHSNAVGYQAGGFSQVISSLTPNTTYYFTAQAVNAGGTVWATPSITFTTPALAVAVITNLPASNVQGTVATLSGRVLNTGNQTPVVTLYYGPSDGGANPAIWSNSISLGAQGDGFAQTISGLTPNTTYYFTASATNGGGTAWATPSQSFTTAATNSPWPFAPMLTQHNDNNRDGDNLNETILNVANVNTNQFGLLYTRPVDDLIYAQPLVMTNVSILGRGSRNLLIIATVNDTVYAYDADDPTVTQPYWTNSFIAPPNIVPPKNTDMTGACGGNYKDFIGNIGIVGTPVIDPASGTLYLVARTKENGSTYVQRLHALDVATGLERSNSPVIITATYAGTGDGGSTETFDPQRSNQRAGLVLVNGTVYITWSSHCDWTPYHGWVLGYDAKTLRQVVVYNTTPNGSEGAIWMSGQAPAADTNGNLYAVTGNGTVDTTTNNDYGEAFLKLTPTNGTMKVASWFVPYNWAALNASDVDLGCGGLLLIPGTTLAISGGKQDVLYLVNRDNMGGSSRIAADTNVVQSWTVVANCQLHGGPVWWSCTNGSFAYVWPQSTNRLRQYQFTNSLFNTTPYAIGPTVGGSGSPGGTMSLSANGTNASTGILWAVVNTSANANQATVAGTLHAYKAQNVTNELWHSGMVAHDSLGNLAKFVPPTVANGKVYMATFSNRLNVYGLLPPPVLGYGLSGTNAVFFWPTNTPIGYTLQSSTNLTFGNWTAVTNAVINSNGMFQVTLPLPGGSANFYRLKL